MKKLFVFDVDGTIATEYKNVNQEVIDCLNSILNKGHVIAIASGRPYIGVKYFLSMLNDGEKYCICANGTEVTDINGNTLFSKMIPMKEYYDFYSRHLNLLKNNDTNIYCYTHRGLGYFKRDFWVDMECKCNPGLPGIDLNVNRLKDEHPILKFMIDTNEEESKRIENEEILDIEKDKFRIVRTSNYFLEFFSKEADKKEGVSFLKQYLNIENNDDIYTFGDSGNDYLMIKEFNGIAMGNALQECKDVAKFVTKSCEENGVVFAIKNYCKL